MKHLLILISILLLSSPVIGSSHKLYRFDSSLDSRSSLSIINYGETLYGWGEYPDYIWKEYGDKETHPTYEGEVKVLSGIFGDYRIIQIRKHHIQVGRRKNKVS